MDIDEVSRSYWAGMPAGLRVRLACWSVYWLLAVWLAFTHPFFGLALIVLPVVFWIVKIWLFEELLGFNGHRGLIVYTIGYLWNSSVYVRVFLGVTLLAAALGSLGWLGTHEMREEAAQLTFTEQVSEQAYAAADKVGNAASATKETAKGWAATAKGWFSREEVPAE